MPGKRYVTVGQPHLALSPQSSAKQVRSYHLPLCGPGLPRYGRDHLDRTARIPARQCGSGECRVARVLPLRVRPIASEQMDCEERAEWNQPPGYPLPLRRKVGAMIGKLLGTLVGAQVSKGTHTAGGTGGALMGAAAVTIARRFGLPGMIAAAIGGYALKRYNERQGAATSKIGPK